MASNAIGETVTLHRDPYAYISHPSITVLHSGDWLAAFNHSRRREPRMHPPTDPLFRTLLARSPDEGVSWEDPIFAPDFDYYGTECPGIAQLNDGTVALTQFRFGWYPIPLARQRRAAGEPISIHLPDRGWTEHFGDDDWAQSMYTWARGYHGLYVHLSHDGGHLFDHTTRIDTGNFRDGYTRTGIIELSDGRAAYVAQEHHPPTNRYTYIVFSSDSGISWSPPSVVRDDAPRLRFGEPDIAEVAPGEILCVLRESSTTRHLFTCRSTDNGETWSSPEETPIFGHPGQLLVLRDGRLLCTYGSREAPFGIRACLSEDGGRHWLLEDEIIVRDDLPNGDLGYPTTIEYAPDKLFVCYYGQGSDGVTYVMGTYVGLQ